MNCARSPRCWGERCERTSEQMGRRRRTRRDGAVERAGPAGGGRATARVPASVGGKNKMIIILKSGVAEAEIDQVCRRVSEMGYNPHVIRGEFKTVVAAVGEERGRQDLRLLEAMETVESVMPVQQPFKLASREVRAEPSEVH